MDMERAEHIAMWVIVVAGLATPFLAMLVEICIEMFYDHKNKDQD